ncbi:MAG: AbrB/MazE/SpoVT family DNA-binding domain-containing protein [Chloroflexota bacterium]|nr:AbrB/MazE/SpoVT family DNA-binding domain-containing protein [Chloroflexota bacterium]
MSTTVTVNRQGRITLPSSIRKELNIGEDATLEVETRDGGIFLRPALVIPREDAWAYTPEYRALVEKARHSPIVPNVNEDDLIAVIEAEDPQAAMRALIENRLDG